mmetsp:Transcript_61996/g.166378  ORF Transcript_61996/g.166378 Transcript_61996/m.166378 type:complete len:161 (+) Transcript_61996:2-484(+)
MVEDPAANEIADCHSFYFACGSYSERAQWVQLALVGQRPSLSALRWMTNPREANTANVNCRDEKGNTPLMAAVRENQAATVRLLIQNGAGLLIRNKFGKTCVDYAPRLQDKPLASFLREKFDRQLDTLQAGWQAAPGPRPAGSGGAGNIWTIGKAFDLSV